MNARQTAVLGSYIAREAVLAPALVATNHAELTALVTALQGKLGEFNEQALAQTEPTEGKTAESRELLDTMAERALEIANAVAAYAEKEHLTDLTAQVAVAPSDFGRLRKLHRPWLAQRIHDAAAGVLEHLAGYEVTAEALTALQADIDAALTGVKEQKRTIVARKVATQNLDTIFAETGRLIEQLDRVVFALRKKHPELYATYRAASVVVGPAGRKRAVTPTPAAVASTVAAAPASAAPVRAESQKQAA